MKFNTVENDFEHQMKAIIETFKKDWEIEQTGEELYFSILKNKAAFGEHVLNFFNDFDPEQFED